MPMHPRMFIIALALLAFTPGDVMAQQAGPLALSAFETSVSSQLPCGKARAHNAHE